MTETIIKYIQTGWPSDIVHKAKKIYEEFNILARARKREDIMNLCLLLAAYNHTLSDFQYKDDLLDLIYINNNISESISRPKWLRDFKKSVDRGASTVKPSLKSKTGLRIRHKRIEHTASTLAKEDDYKKSDLDYWLLAEKLIDNH